MNHHHGPWRPSPAAKPAHLTSTQQNSNTNSAALLGATTAFATSPKHPPVVQRVHNQQEAETNRERPPSKTSNVPSRARSRSRGRHLSPDDALAASAHATLSGTSPPTRNILARTSSVLAARIASASPSPVRNLASTSPLVEEDRAKAQERNDEILKKKVQARLAKVPDQIEAVPEPKSTTAEVPVAAALDFENLPDLHPKTWDAADTDRSPSLGVVPKVESERTMSPHVIVNKTTPIPVPARRVAPRTVVSPTNREAITSNFRLPTTVRSKPPTPAPRKGRTMERGPIRANLTGPKQTSGASREEVINRMADAMVASSLASTRTPSPTKATRAPTFGRRSASATNLYRQSTFQESTHHVQQHKPQRPLKQTLRKASAEDEDDGREITKRGRRHLVRKHPNMHHEGDRKRWWDEVTQPERRRYEGVFAANRGLLLRTADPRASPSRLVDPTSESNQVVNVVVRDIWDRSRLPAQTLEQIYDLVAPGNPRTLNREQFVVGLWLIDQKLKGRKLPPRVSESIWTSVRHIQGIKISTRP